MHKAIVTVALACTVGLTGCATNAGTGAGVGCLAGGLIGAMLLKDAKAGAALGCAAGGVVGFAWGSYLDEKERKELAEASARAAAEGRTGERVAWGGPEAAPTSTTEPTANAKVATKGKHRPKPKSAPAHTGTASASNTRTASAAQTNGATGWVVPVSDVYVENGKTYRKLHQVATKDGKTYEHDVIAYKDGSTWVVPGST
ncbi:MAG: glycine zipper domain-containing protein [Rhizomicrobium sp.]